MKTEREIVDRLEAVAKKLEELGSTLPEADPDGPITEAQVKVAVTLAVIATLGFVLDCEKEVAEIGVKLKLGAVLHAAKKAL